MINVPLALTNLYKIIKECSETNNRHFFVFSHIDFKTKALCFKDVDNIQKIILLDHHPCHPHVANEATSRRGYISEDRLTPYRTTISYYIQFETANLMLYQ